MTSNHTKLWNKIDTLEQKIDKILITTTRNEEHLRQINGTLKRHEDSIANHDKKINQLYYYLGMGMGAVAVIALVIDIAKSWLL